MKLYGFPVASLAGVPWGASVALGSSQLITFLARAEADSAPLLELFHGVNGLLVLRGCSGIGAAPELLVQASRLFGPEVENYRDTPTAPQFFHPTLDEVLVLSNLPPCRFDPPARPTPELTIDGRLPTAWPQRNGWHADQSYRRPPPDVSLLFGERCPPHGEGQTLYFDGISAFEALAPHVRDDALPLTGLHVARGTGRTGREVLAGAERPALPPNRQPQRQPLVRTHPVSGARTLYLCDEVQMDFVDGPFCELSPGVDGEGAHLLADLLGQCTAPGNVYIHEWDDGDLLVHDNRNMMHTPTWYDAKRHPRTLWRTTVMGSPDPAYAGEARSWLSGTD